VLDLRRRELITLIGGAWAAFCVSCFVFWPVAARAEPAAVPVIGFMSGRSPEDSVHLVAAFRRGLGEVDVVEGQNIAIEYRWGLGQYERMPALAAGLVSRRVAVLVGVGGDVSARAAEQATSTIPVVFGGGGDPVKAGLVESLSRPGRNATGFTLLTNEMEPKRLGMLHDLMPGATIIGALLNPSFPPAARQRQDLEDAARTIGQQLFISKASNDVELDAAFVSLVAQRVGALLVAADPYFDMRRDRIIALADQNRLPAMYQFREYPLAGGLISYGPSITDMYRQAGIYTARILKGAKPADLPVVQPTRFELVINLKTAKTLGLDLPDKLLALADEVIE
jgi:putative ABC transport system substrate-binding protein